MKTLEDMIDETETMTPPTIKEQTLEDFIEANPPVCDPTYGK